MVVTVDVIEFCEVVVTIVYVDEVIDVACKAVESELTVI